MKQHEKARAWRNKRGLTIAQLSNLTGYGWRAITWLEKGQAPPNASRAKPAPVADNVWQRYRMLCAGVDAQLKTGKKFEW